MHTVAPHHNSLSAFVTAAALSLATAVMLSSCTTAQRLERLDRRAMDILESARKSALGDYMSPEDFAIDNYQPWMPPKAPSGDAKPVELNLKQALELAAKHSREYQNAKETLYNSALALVGEMHQWDWNPVNNLSAVFGIQQHPSSQSTFTTSESLGFTKRLLSGGRLTGSLAMNTLRYCSGDKSISIGTLAMLTLNQPLLAGSGQLVARESLTQAERNLVYALRTYVRTREALLIKIAGYYYDVLNAEADLRIGKLSHASLSYSFERSSAMSESGRVTQIDVDQARQRVLSAESNLVTFQEAIQTAKDTLKVALAIPLDTDIVLDQQDMSVMLTMELPKPAMSLQQAIQLALGQRLDYATVRDRLEDAQRAVAIARDAMRARLDLSASASAAGTTGNRISTPRIGEANYSIGLEADLPLDRTNQTIALKRATIALARQQRQIDESREELIQSLRRVWNNLNAYGQKLNIQKMSVALAEKRVENTRMLFEDGRIAIREYLDAQDDLSNARNSLTRQLVSHRMCWLQLLYQLGDLRVDPQSFWTNRLEVKSAGK